VHILALYPTVVTPAGGNVLTVYGSGFRNASGGVVTLNCIFSASGTGSPVASPAQVRNSSQLTCVVPALGSSVTATTGLVTLWSTVEVTDATDGTVVSTDGQRLFYYPAPTVSTLTPSSVAAYGGTAVTVTGTFFARVATLACRVRDGSVSGVVAPAFWLSYTQIECIVPAVTAALDNTTTVLAVDVTNNGVDYSSALTLTYLPSIRIDSLTPAIIPQASTTVNISITGFGFNPARATRCVFGGTLSVAAKVVSGTVVTCLVPASLSLSDMSASVNVADDLSISRTALTVAFQGIPTVQIYFLDSVVLACILTFFKLCSAVHRLTRPTQ
jgi:hypothetical protein